MPPSELWEAEGVAVWNIDAELSMIGSALLSADAARWMTAHLPPRMFYRPAHRLMARAIATLVKSKTPVDAVTLKSQLLDLGNLEDIGGDDYITQALDFTPSAANFQFYGIEIQRKYHIRETREMASKLSSATDPSEALREFDRWRIQMERELAPSIQLHNGDRVRKAIAAGEEVYFCPSISDSDLIDEQGFTGTASPDGRWHESFINDLRGGDIVVVAEYSAVGGELAASIGKGLAGLVKSLRIVKPATDVLGHGVADHFAAGHSIFQFVDAPTLLPPPSVVTFKPYTIADLKQLPAKEWLIENLLGRGDRGFIYGKPGRGKTFIGLDLLLSAIKGKAFAGRFGIDRPLRGIYMAGEKKSGIPGRIHAGCAWHSITEEDEERFLAFLKVPQLFELGDPESVDVFLRELSRIAPGGTDLLLIDTQHMATVGAEENDQSDAAVCLRSEEKIADALGCGIVKLHHPDKQNLAPRGSSAWIGSADFIFRLDEQEGGNGSMEMRCEKMGNGPSGYSVPYRLVKSYEVDSLYVQWDVSGEEANEEALRKEEVIRVVRSFAGSRVTAKQIADAMTIPTSTDAARKIANRLWAEARDLNAPGVYLAGTKGQSNVYEWRDSATFFHGSAS